MIGWSKLETGMGRFAGLRALISWNSHLLPDSYNSDKPTRGGRLLRKEDFMRARINTNESDRRSQKMVR